MLIHKFELPTNYRLIDDQLGSNPVLAMAEEALAEGNSLVDNS